VAEKTVSVYYNTFFYGYIERDIASRIDTTSRPSNIEMRHDDGHRQGGKAHLSPPPTSARTRIEFHAPANIPVTG